MKNLLAFFLHSWRCLRAARPGQYDAIQVRDQVFFAVLALWRARQLKVPFYYWMSFPMSEGSIELVRTHGLRLGIARFLFVALKGYLGKWLMYSYVLPRADHVYVQSDRMLMEVADKGISRAKMTPVPMGTDMFQIDNFKDSPIDDPILSGKRVLVYLGTLDRNRSVDFLFEVVRQVRVVFPDVLLVLAGEAPEEVDRQWLQQRAVEIGVQHEIYKTGWLPTFAAWRYVTAAEVGLSAIPRSFLFDCASPTKAVEYLALGIPVVVNDQPDQAAVVSESGAGFCVPYSVGAFADAVNKILNNPDLAREMRDKGPSYIRDHRSYRVLARKLAAEYLQLAKSFKKHPETC